jgi:hypothetical protein
MAKDDTVGRVFDDGLPWTGCAEGGARLFATADPAVPDGNAEGRLAEADGFRLASNAPAFALAYGWEEPEPERVFAAKV